MRKFTLVIPAPKVRLRYVGMNRKTYFNDKRRQPRSTKRVYLKKGEY